MKKNIKLDQLLVFLMRKVDCNRIVFCGSVEGAWNPGQTLFYDTDFYFNWANPNESFCSREFLRKSQTSRVCERITELLVTNKVETNYEVNIQ